MLRKSNIKDIYSLSPMQEGLLFHALMDENSAAYFEQSVITIKGELDIPLLEKSFNLLVERYDSLRTVFSYKKTKNPMQILLKKRELKINFEDISHLSAAEAGDYVDYFVEQDRAKGFDLTKDMLIRISLLKMDKDLFRLVWSHHHIIMDGWCLGILYMELMTAYHAFRRGEPANLSPVVPYSNFIKWLEQYDKEEGMRYWREYLDGYEEQTVLPGRSGRDPGDTYTRREIEYTMDEDLSARLRAIARDYDVTLNTLFQTLWGVMLQKCNNREDAVFGAVVSGRPPEIPGIETMVGLFLNTLPLRVRVPGTGKIPVTFAHVLENLKAQSVTAKLHEATPLVEIQRLSTLKGELFDHIIAFQNFPVSQVVKESSGAQDLGFTVTAMESFEQTSYDFVLNVGPGDRIFIRFTFNRERYSLPAVRRIIAYFDTLTRRVAENPGLPLDDVDFISQEEKHRLLYRFNDTGAGYPHEKTIHRLFEQQVMNRPHAPALVYPGEKDGPGDRTSTVTYGQLDHMARRIALLLKEKGVGTEVIVGMLLERSIHMIAAILGILKAGGIYMPIDPEYPGDRITYILEDSHAPVLLATPRPTDSPDYLSDAGVTFDGEILYIDDSLSTCPPLTEQPALSTAADDFVTPSNAAYIIYTSGTTGRPKGVIIEHMNVVRLMFNDKFQFDFDENDVWTMFHSYCFDFSVWEIYGALLYGGCLVMVPKMVARDPARYLGLLETYRVSVLNQTPSAFYNLLHEEMKRPEKNLAVRYIVFGGEALNPVKLEPWEDKYPACRLINMFGITETTVHVTFKEIRRQEIEAGISNVGVPIPTLSVYILDRNLKLLPIGAAGELCVGGDGVGRGYLNRPQLTSKKFVPGVFKENERLYRSGDLGRYDEDGDIEYMGRIDLQVKIRGFRIELGEIESCLLKHHSISEAVVIARKNSKGDNFLCAYIVVPEGSLSTAQLREYLSQGLPDYMIPSYFVPIEQIPLTSNGKVDRRALPEPRTGAMESGEAYVPPSNETEEKLVNIWKRALGMDKLGTRDNFFNAGGDSIKTISTINLVNKEFNGDFKIADLYVHNTVEKFAHFILQGERAGRSGALEDAAAEIEALKNRVLPLLTPPEGTGEIADVYPMSDIETGMVFYTLRDSESAVYHDQFVYQLNYPGFRQETFKAALRLLVQKHSILRTAFNVKDFEEPLQIVWKTVEPDIRFFDISQMDKARQAEHINRFTADDRGSSFNMSAPPLWRAVVFTLDPDHICLVFVFHHSALDGWSLASLITELNNTYLASMQDPGFVPQPLASSYKDFIIEQRAGQKETEVSDFWKKELEDYKRLDFSALGKQEEKGGLNKFQRRLESTLLEKLKTFAAEHKTSVKHLCFAAYMYMLNMLSYDDDIVAGLITNSRPVCRDGEKILGCFLNTVPVRIKVPHQLKWIDYARLVDRKMVRLKRYDRLAFFRILRTLGEETREDNPIFDTIFNYIDFHVYETASATEGQTRQEMLDVEGFEDTNTMLDLTVSTTFDVFNLSFTYSRSFIADDGVATLCRYFEGVLDKIVHEPHAFASKEHLIPEAEKKELLYDFNDTAAGYPREKTIHRLFRDQAEANPDRIALVGCPHPGASAGETELEGDTVCITYGKLSQISGRLALILRAKGVGPDSVVGLMTERSLEMMLGIYGILKAGGAYLPISPSYPAERARYILSDGSAPILLTTRSVTQNMDIHFDRSWLYFDDLDIYRQPPAGGGAKSEAAVSDLTSRNLAYVIYTSGSTGRPKGVAIEHHSVVNRLKWMQKAYPIGSTDVIVQKTPYVFDVSVWELFWWAFEGSKLALLGPEEEKKPGRIIDTIYREGVTTMHFVPSMLNAFLDYLEGVAAPDTAPGRLTSLRQVFASGEALLPKQAERFNRLLHRANRTELINLYGPTEATVDVSYYNLGDRESFETIPIGKPIDNTGLHILDKNLRLLPRGVPGELCISGVGLARGYLNRPQLTREKFVYSTHFTSPELLYRTGDLARRLPDRNIEFLGRLDVQVKIRGFRIELGEIENLLAGQEPVKETVVMARKDRTGDHFICAYAVVDESFPLDPAKEEEINGILKTGLSRKLPDYMIPSYFVLLDKFPLTPSGKVDRKALPGPLLKTGAGYVPPETPHEKTLTGIWSGVLGIPAELIGAESGFFELGGHSLKAITLVAAIHKKMHVKLKLAEVFKLSTIRRMARHFKGVKRDVYQPIEPAAQKQYYPLTSAQKRMYFVELITRDLNYNMPTVVIMEGNVSLPRFTDAFRKLIRRHEAYRTSFKLLDDRLVQEIHPPGDITFEIEYSEGDETQCDQYINRFIRLFDFNRPPLLRVGLLKIGPQRYLFIIDLHHIVNDGLSFMILIHDFAAFYNNEELPGVRVQYKDYTAWQNCPEQREAIDEQERFWLRELGGELPVLNLPLDYPRPRVQQFEAEMVEFILDTEETGQIRRIAAESSATLFITLLAVLDILLAKLSGQEDIIIGTPLGGRRHEDLGGTVGMFVDTLVLRAFPMAQCTFTQFLEQVTERTFEAFENQQFEFDDLVEKLGIERDISRNPIFDVMYELIHIDEFAMEGSDERFQDFKVLPYESFSYMLAKFDLGFYVQETRGVLDCNFRYCIKLFKKESMNRYVSYFKNIVQQVLSGPSIEIGAIGIITAGERKEILNLFNLPSTPYPGEAVLHQIFQRRAEAAPEAAAVTWKKETGDSGDSATPPSTITYARLAAKVNRLELLLREQGLQPGQVVGMMLERSLEMVAGILAVLKAGGVYLPMSPQNPLERIRFMLADCDALLLLTTPSLSGEVPPDIPVLYPDLTEEDDGRQPVEAPPPEISPHSPAYVIYTSGTTGRPKGVMVEHRNAVNILDALQDMYPLEDDGVYLLKTNYTFDVSVSELFGWFFGTGSLALLEPGGEKEPAAMAEAIHRFHVTHINFVPSMLAVFVDTLPGDQEEFKEKLADLKYLMVAGEAFSRSLAEKIANFGAFNHRRLRVENLYGPTEAAVYSTGFALTPSTLETYESVPIGKPLKNIVNYILDPGGNLTPLYVAGELHIGGAGVARGYLNRPQLTAEKFIPNTFPLPNKEVEAGEKLYRTGDLVRWLPGGVIEYLGRIDHQVKIRGFRIETGEIESLLAALPRIKDAVVIVRNVFGEDALCAYCVPRETAGTIDFSQLETDLAKHLPQYMIPSYFISIETIPLTANGKLDRKALPEPSLAETAETYVAPRDEIEESLVNIWSEVLGAPAEAIGIDSNFFRTGGHSLRATVMMSRIHRELGVPLPLAEVFKTPTIRGLAQYVRSTSRETLVSIEPAEKKEYYSLSSAQRRLYILQRMEPQGIAYNMPQVMPLAPGMDTQIIRDTFSRLIQRHESLRTSFRVVEEEPVQQVLDPGDASFSMEYRQVEEPVESGAGEPGAPVPSAVEELMKTFIRPFDLSRAPLLRAGVLRLMNGAGDFLVMDMHHIITDGVSQALLEQEFIRLYRGETPPPLKLQYKDFAQWQNRDEQAGALQRQESYWLDCFSGEIPVLDLPADLPRPLVQDFSGSSIEFQILTGVEKLKAAALDSETTLFMVLIAITSILLSKLSGKEDIVIGSPVAGRRHPDIQDVVGMFVNTLALRTFPAGEKNFRRFLHEVKESTLAAFENQEYHFEDLVEKLDVNRDISRNPLFDHMFVLQNMEAGQPPYSVAGAEDSTPDTPAAPVTLRHITSKFDITFYCTEIENKLYFTVEYSTALFKKETVERFVRYYKQIVTAVAGDDSPGLSQLEIISAAERREILDVFNMPPVPYPDDAVLHDIFQRRAGAVPETPAVIWGAPVDDGGTPFSSITYEGVSAKVNRLALLLREKGTGPGQVVGIMAERSLDMVIAILAVLKAGGAYLPIAPQHPEERIRFMLTDSAARLLLSTTTSLTAGLPGDIQTLRLDQVDEDESPQPGGGPLPAKIDAQSPAYVIYTSGTTGRPKGVMVEHGNAVNILAVLQDMYPLEDDGVYLLKTNYTFDVSVTELFGWFFGTGRLALLETGGEKEPAAMVEAVHRFSVTHINFVPSMLSVFLDTVPGDDEEIKEKLASLKYLMVAGEAFSRSLAEKIAGFSALNHDALRVENIYGPTEAAVYSTGFPVSPSTLENYQTIPIGKPLKNILNYVLDRGGNLVPLYVAGELYIGGAGVARGYLNRPELTAEKFIAKTFFLPGGAERSGAGKLYRTGDLVRWLPGGVIEYLGRMDQQVKIRGFRIETGEIENLLAALPQVKDAVVIVRDLYGERNLCAYFIPSGAGGLDETADFPELEAALANHLPQYMIPSYFIPIETIPLTANGKLDRKALPAPPVRDTGEEYVAPRDDTERKLARLWAGVLGIDEENIGIDSRFFRLGGHSLKATVLVTHVHREFGVHMPLTVVFNRPTVRQMAGYIHSAARTAEYAAIEPAEAREYYPLSSSQNRMYILQQMDPGATAYNIPGIYPFTAGDLDLQLMERTFQRLMQRHEGLRTSFVLVDGEPVQRIHDAVPFEIERLRPPIPAVGETPSGAAAPGVHTSLDEILKEAAGRFVRPFPLSQAPLLRVGVLEMPPSGKGDAGAAERLEGKCFLMVDMHHVISDGVSMQVLIRDYRALYGGEVLSPLDIQYKDYALWQHRPGTGDALRKQEEYWLEKFRDGPPLLDLPTDFPRPAELEFQGGTAGFSVAAGTAAAMDRLAARTGTTRFMLLMSIFNLFLARHSGQEDILVGTPVAGRLHADLEDIIGVFVNTLVIWTRPLAEKPFKHYLEEVKIQTLEALENQEYPFEELVERLVLSRDISRNPLFDVMFILAEGGAPGSGPADDGGPPIDFGVSAVDLTLAGAEKGDYLEFSVEYRTRLFRRETIERFIRYFKNMLTISLETPGIALGEMDFLPQEEKRQLLVEFNLTPAGPVEAETLHQLFRRQVERSPHRTALVAETSTRSLQLSYRHLDRYARLLARYLREQGVAPGSIVALITERSAEMFAGILGVLYAGCAYMPIDKDAPSARLGFMLEDSNASMVLTAASFPIDALHDLRETMAHPGGSGHVRIVELTDFTGKPMEDRLPSEADEDVALPESIDFVGAGSLAYVIYTSGSTGRPKGVLVEHRQVAAYIAAFFQEFDITAEDAVVQLSAYTFDAFVEEVFPILLRGGKIVIPGDPGRMDIDELAALIVGRGVTVIDCSPLLLNEFNRLYGAPGDGNPLAGVRIFISGGDVLKKEYVNHLVKQGRVYNTYGPTESTVCASYYRCGAGDWEERDSTALPIGRPIAGYSLYILDKHYGLQPVGVAGELCVAGPGITRGYLNRPELTAERFVSSPNTQYPIPNQRAEGPLPSPLYKTGDLVRWRPDGNIEFLGRIDHQVKLRGFRIELGEIENHLLGHHAVGRVVVLDRGEGDAGKYLCAYIVAAPGYRVESPGLREYLAERLPAYMIPSYFVGMEKIPLNTHGKVDRKALPGPETGAGEAYVAPAGSVEQQLAEVWAGVLGIQVDGISATANFFTLGGHSLKATILVSQVHKALNVKVPVAELFKGPTIRAMAEFVRHAGEERYVAVEPVETRQYYPLSSPQKRMYILQRMDPRTTAYNIPGGYPAGGPVDIGKLEQIFTALIKRHESLRTSFRVVVEEPVQVVHETVPFAIETLRLGPRESIAEAFGRFIRPFDLSHAPLLRVGLLNIPGETGHETQPGSSPQEDRALLLVDMHHVISDGISFQVLTRDFQALYRGQTLEPLEIQYKDFAMWKHSHGVLDGLVRQEAFWLERFQGEIPLLNLPADFPRPEIQRFDGASVSFHIPASRAVQLKTLAMETNGTLFMVMLALFDMLLARLGNQEDIVVGVPIAGRRHADLQHIIGMFVNTLAMRNYPTGEKSFKNFLREVRHSTLEAFENQEYPFEDLVEQLDVNRDLGRNPLFDVMFNLASFDDASQSEALPVAGPVEEEVLEPETAKFDVTLTANETGEGIACNMNYCTLLFRETTIRRFIQYFETVVEAVLTDPGMPIHHIHILSTQEREQLLQSFSITTGDYPRQGTLHYRFEEQVERNPHSTAVVFEGSNLTYNRLNTRANRLAHRLREKGAGPGTLAGLLLSPSPEMLTGMLAVLKAGAAYVPIAPDTPPERSRYIVKDCNISVLLTTGNDDPGETVGGCEKLRLDDPVSYHSDSLNLPGLAAEEAPAYCIFTSGSTGRPKGTLVRHGSVVNELAGMQALYPVGAGDVYLLKTAFTFDVSVTECFGWFFGGGMVAVLSRERAGDPREIIAAIKEHRVTHVNFVPSLFHLFVQVMTPDRALRLASLKYIFLAGEAIWGQPVETFRQLGLPVRLENLYGPTEATIYASYYAIAQWTGQGSIPIGRPFPNHRLYVLDRHLQLLPVGVPGQLFIGGEGLALGYLNRPELTSEYFVSPDGSNYDGLPSHLYKTGDLARWLPDGNVEFLGRIDFQVKVRGFRIELGEIENTLLHHEHIREAVVTMREEDDDKYLCAYVSGYDGQDGLPPEAQLREFLAVRLPGYMVPAHFVILDNIPLTSSGKIDRKALPAPQIAGAERGYIAPRDETEKKLVSLWAPLLGIPEESTGINDNFFRLGGHSLKATILVSQLHKAFDIQMPLSEVFNHPTLRQMAGYIRSAERSAAYSAIEPTELREYYPLSSPQNRMYVLQQMEPGTTAYNIPGIFPFMADQVDFNRLEFTFNRLIERHQGLRTSFHMANGEPVQKIHETVPFDIEYYQAFAPEDSDGAPAAAEPGGATSQMDVIRDIAGHFIRPFLLSRPPLLRVGVVETQARWEGDAAPGEKNKGKCLLMVDMHHVISDGVSLQVLIRDYQALYRGDTLPPLDIQYKDYALWQQRPETTAGIRKQIEFWLNTFKGEPPILNLPTDYPRPEVQRFDGASISFEVPAARTGQLKSLAMETGTTLFMVMLTLFDILLAKLGNQEDIVVGVPIAGRRHADLQHIIGMFVNTLAMRNYPTGDTSFKNFLQEVRHSTLEAFENQEYPFEDLVGQLDVNRDLGRNPLFDVMFNLGSFDESPEIVPDAGAVEEEVFEPETAKFDVTLTANETGERIACSMNYCTLLFRETTIRRFIQYFETVVEAAVTDPGRPIHRIHVLSPQEREQLLQSFSITTGDYPRQGPLHSRFEEQVERNPHGTAVVFEGSNLTYNRLNTLANRLAHRLREKGAGPGTLAGLLLSPSLEMLTGMLAVLKAGAAYVPIAPDTPPERSRYILKDCNISVLLTTGNDDPGETTGGCEMLRLDDPVSYHSDSLNLPGLVDEEAPAYCIFTSGSTGRPKGTLVRHGSVVNELAGMQALYPVEAGDVYLLKTAFTFDVSVTECFGWFFGGGMVAVLSRERARDPREIIAAIKEHRVTHVNFVPALFHLFTQLTTAEPAPRIASLKYIFLAGEAIWAQPVETFRALGLPVRLENLYGPTEATIYASYYSISQWAGEGSIPIGRPFPNHRMYILDRYLQLLPVGVAGQLFIGGEGLAQGYLNRPELTAESFLKIGHDSLPSRLYKTGDLARWLPDGNIEFLGRIDFQVKVRGFRIELGEIENLLLTHEDIRGAVVVLREDDGDKYLCAYISGGGEPAEIPTGTQLREFLSKNLPDYMIPAYFVTLDKLPLTSSGKINRKALPAPESAGTQQEYIAPRNEIELKLADIWAEVLRRENKDIGIDHGFFQLGGHSLKATVMVARLYKELKVRLPLVEIFRSGTIRKLAKLIEEKTAAGTGEEARVTLLTPRETRERRLFLVHDGSGEVDGYYELGRHLPKGIDLWGIRAGDFAGTGPRVISVKDLAEQYVRLVQSIQPHGPYAIGGWSIGGTIAFEMIRQLETGGEDTEVLLMIDTVPALKSLQKQVTDFNIDDEMKWLLRLLPGGEIRKDLKKAAAGGPPWPALVELLEQRPQLLEPVLKNIPPYIFQVLPGIEHLPPGELVQRINRLRGLENARNHYTPPGKIRTPLVFFSASESTFNKQSWQDDCSKTVSWHELESDHFSILLRPSVKALSEILGHLLKAGE